jgi:hypothetical protein
MKLYGQDEFIQKAKEAVLLLAIAGIDPTDKTTITIDDVYVVNTSYVLGNMKAQLSTTLTDGRYYEVTYDDSKEEMYAVGYCRIISQVIK